MLDSLTLALALALPARPSMDRLSVVLPPPVAVVVAGRREEPAPPTLTTCYQGRAGSCWTEE